MDIKERELIDKLDSEGRLSESEYADLIRNRDDEAADLLKNLATGKRKTVFSDTVYIRGLIELSSYCKNNCLYCGIRRDNAGAQRYRLTKEEILDCA